MANPVRWQREEESEPIDQPLSEPTWQTWEISGRRYQVKDATSEAEYAPRLTPEITRGIPYIRPRGPRTILTWED